MRRRIRAAVDQARAGTFPALGPVELEGGRIVLRKDVDDAISRVRGRVPLPPGVSTDDIMRELRGRAPGDPLPEWDSPASPHPVKVRRK